MRIVFSVRSLLLALGMMAMSAVSSAQVVVGISITIAPPELPVYEQPMCPGDGYIWTPGYWAYGDDDYYWVPGTWVIAPEVGSFWTPGYWAWESDRYFFHEGYWGPEVGFYGGIDYGFGYFGHGYEGGRWDNGRFFYNRAVTNINVTIVRNVYETRVDERNSTRVSFNGGSGGINERPTNREEAAAHERHIPRVAAQNEHLRAARANPDLRASANHGKPPVAATPKPGDFKDRGVVAAREAGAVHGSPARPDKNAARPTTPIHPRDIPPAERPAAAPNTGNRKQDQKYQQQQERLQQKQDQEHQKLQQKQDQEHQRMEQQKAKETRKQQVEQRHQQQTQQLAQKHAQQQQKMQQRQQPPPRPNQPKPPKDKP
jgi:YXWGXW repeat-containing protein